MMKMRGPSNVRNPKTKAQLYQKRVSARGTIEASNDGYVVRVSVSEASE